jgi:hypothetical protein
MGNTSTEVGSGVDVQPPRRSISFSEFLKIKKKSAARLRRKGGRFPSFLLDSKIIAYEFFGEVSKEINVRVPKMYGASLPISQIRPRDKMVVKPVSENTARGVFIVNDPSDILYLNRNQKIYSWNEFIEYANRLMVDGVVKDDRWIAEELISNGNVIARDLKFYAFYGRVGLVLETKRLPEIKRCWYNGDGKRVKTGKYDGLLFDGEGGYAEEKSLAEQISRSIPSPFARIDVMSINGIVYIGEITPIPGKFYKFNNFWDERLGYLFADSAIRLSHDLAHGEVFSHFNNFVRDERKIIDKINELSSS